MANEIVTAPVLSPPVGYAHAVVAGPGRIVHLGGQTALDAEGKISGEDLPAQLDVIAANVVADYRRQLPELGKVWQRHFGRHYPATGLFGVTRLFDEEALIELMGVAV